MEIGWIKQTHPMWSQFDRAKAGENSNFGLAKKEGGRLGLGTEVPTSALGRGLPMWAHQRYAATTFVRCEGLLHWDCGRY